MGCSRTRGDDPAGEASASSPGTSRDVPRAFYLKRNPLPNSEDLELEARKLEWLRERHPVPRVVRHSRSIVDDCEVEYLVTEALPGTNAVAPENAAEANRTIVEIAEGLRMLHSLPVDDCRGHGRLRTDSDSSPRRRSEQGTR
ncbi:phosphotransferase [Brevibacterium sp. ZH18]|uniref:phosphotransferase n=1 Tax=Brevibacterium sp. ZH18 TaxID=2927784 RepID=UPI0024170B4A|nr:phosphotransferase [Brevibacterium sp. ZH18]